MKLLFKEFDNSLTMIKRCQELTAINKNRETEGLGNKNTFLALDSESSNSDDDSSSQQSISEQNEEVLSSNSKLSAAITSNMNRG